MGPLWSFLAALLLTAVSLSSGRTPSTADSGNSTDADRDDSGSHATDTAQPATPRSFQFMWLKGHWTQCNAVCEGGEKHRPVICYDATEERHVADHYCPTPKPRNFMRCAMEKCPAQWKTGPWSACTASCGVGIQYRHVACHLRHSHGNEQDQAQQGTGRSTRDVPPVKITLCNPATKPNNVKFCEGTANNCPPSLIRTADNMAILSDITSDAPPSRRSTERSERSSPEEGQKSRRKRRSGKLSSHIMPRRRQTRSVIEETGLGAPEGGAFHLDQPRAVWALVSTNGCSATCGKGTITYKAVCINPRRTRATLQPVEDIVCGNSTKPSPFTLDCMQRPCSLDVYQWVETDWKPCNAFCGPGTRSRRQVCYRISVNATSAGMTQTFVRRTADRTRCGRRPPSTQESCNEGECGQWDVGEWSKCNTKCGEEAGFAWRTVQCVNTFTGQPTLDCEPNLRPEQVRPCPATENCSKHASVERQSSVNHVF